MNRMKRIVLILLIALLLPALFFSVYQVSSLNDDEQMIEEIYEKQLDAILFSANQYSNDMLEGWVRDFQLGLKKTDSTHAPLNEFFQFNTSITEALVANTSFEVEALSINREEFHKKALQEAVSRTLHKNDSLVNLLTQFFESGFQKKESLSFDHDSVANEVLFVFHLDESYDDYNLGVLIIDSHIFTDDVLAPKLQQIAQEQFELTVLQKSDESLVYTTGENDSLVSTYSYKKDLWLLPDYELAIKTTGTSLESVITNRTYFNLVLIIILDLTIILGLWLVFKNVRKEVRLAQAKSDFVSNVSHEIRTPLSLISMFTETLLYNRVKDEKKKQEYYGIINKEAQRLTTIVNKILSFSQLDAEKRAIEPVRLSLNDLVKDIIDTYEYHLSTNGFTWQTHSSDEVFVLADKNALEEIIINLLDNAVKYSEQEKNIIVSIGKNADYGFLSIKDKGTGISKEDLPYIFDKFFRVHTGNLAKKKGTGLGLALVKQLLERQDGRVEVESQLNMGSTFTIYLPLDEA